MSSKLKSDNIGNDSRNGQALVNSAYQNTSVKSKVDFIFGAVPSRSKNDILLVLQSCDYNVDAAISMFSQGGADDILNQWSHKGKRSKDGSKKKRNKKKQGSATNAQDVDTRKEEEKEKKVEGPQEQQLVNSSAQPPAVQLSPDSPKLQVPTNLSLNTSDDGASQQESNVNGISTMSSNSSTSSDPITPSEEPALPNKQKDQPNHSSSHHHHHHHHKSNKHGHHSKPEKLSPTTGVDALKKTTKDLSRSSFSLGRYHLVLEEECEQSLKRLTKTFGDIRSCIDEREATLTKALKEFQEEAVNLLQQRAEDAAALKLKTDRVQSMSEEQIALLRADIKNFVAERKIDEELAQTKRFICDEEGFLQGIKTFGEVVPIKSTYTPVVLNHPTPSPSTAPKPSSTNTQPSLVNHSSENKPSSTTQSATVAKIPEALSLPKSPEPQTTHSVTIRPQNGVNKSGRPPKIESLISSAMAKTSIAVGNLKDAATIHSKLKEDAEKQDIVSQNEAKKENPGQEHKQSRPATAPHQSGQHQHKRPQEPRPRRPQTSRNRTNQRQNKDENTSNKLNETSQTDEVRAKTSQRGASSGHNEKRRDRYHNGSHRSTEGTPESNSPREGGNKRPPRRRRRGGRDDIKAKSNGEEQAKDAAEVNVEKESGKRAANEDRQTEIKEGREDEGGKKEAKAEHISTDGALPQRTPRNQNRRKFRGREKDDSKEPAAQHLNGASNGLANDHAANGEEAEKIETAEKEEKIAKPAVVVDKPLINGHSEDPSENTLGKAENRDKMNKKENIEINGLATSNGNGDDCMVGR